MVRWSLRQSLKPTRWIGACTRTHRQKKKNVRRDMLGIYKGTQPALEERNKE